MKKKKNKKKGEMPRFGSKAYIDWINKKNKVRNYVPKTDTEYNETKPHEVILGLIVLAVAGFFIFNIASDGFKKGSKYLDDRSSRKVYCAERADSASTSYAAKKIYKACMSR